MTLRVNPELEALLLAETTQYSQVRALGAALTANKRVKAKHHPDAAATQDAVWSSGTLFRDAALNGACTYSGAIITGYGITSNLTTSVAADLAVGKAVMRIEGGGHWVEGTIGLEGSEADFTLAVNPTASNSFAISPAMRLLADQTLPVGTPDVAAPTISIATSESTQTVAGFLTVSANPADDVGVTRVEFYRNSVMVLSKIGSPWTYSDYVDHTHNGSIAYYAKAFDAAGNSTTSATVNVTVTVPAPVESGEPTPVGMELTSITLVSTDAAAQTNVPVTFGQHFTISSLPGSNAAVELRAPNDAIIPCQLDVKATHPNGSVRHAIISAVIPSMAGMATLTYSILRKAAPLTGTAPIPANFSGLNAVATLTDTGTDVSGPVVSGIYTADAAPLLAAGTYQTWLSGPIVSEWILRVPLKTAGGVEHPDLHARFSIRAYAGQSRAKIDYVIENNWAKPKAVPSGTSPWESVGITDKVYRVSLKAGATTTYTRTTQGNITVRIGYSAGVFNNSTTRLLNDATVYNATVVVDGGAPKAISVTGSAVQTFGQLISAINSQLAGAATIAADPTNLHLQIKSATTGSASSVRITDYGTLFPALTATKFASSTTYTGAVTIDGSIVKSFSVLGVNAQSYALLSAILNTQMGGAATCTPQQASPGLRFVSATTGQTTSVVVSTPGTLFPAMEANSLKLYRPIYGDEFVHFARTRWKKTYWWGTAPSVHIAHNKAYLMASKAVPNYDPALTGSSATITASSQSMDANSDLGLNGITKAFMGDVGYAPGIGLLPEWTAMYIVNQGATAKATMLKQADLGGSWPMYSRDFNTDMPINFEHWPYASYGGTPGDSKNPATGLNEKLPDLTPASTVPAIRNLPDVAHHPDFFYVPYLVTGDHYYMEGLLFHHRFLGLNANPHLTVYRGARKCLWKGEQPRGLAWSMRTTVHAAYITPDSHPIKGDVLYSLAQNREWLDTNYTSPSGQYHNIFGFLHHAFGLAYSTAGGANTGGAPWMDDFITSATGRAIELGFTEFQPFMQFKAKYPVGRLTSGSAYCWQLGAVYTMRFKQSTSSSFYNSWAEVYVGTVKPEVAAAQCGTQEMMDALMLNPTGVVNTVNSMTGYPDSISGFPANMQPAVAYSASYAGVEGDNAWTVFDARAVQPDYNTGPQFAIVPRN